jgi:predicted secreted protein with PEFG-CTERM motif
MKSKLIGLLFIIVILVVGIMAFNPSAFADTSVTITKGAGDSQNPACVTTNNCFTPNPVQVSSGDKVTWTNTDTSPCTVTSGTQSNTTDVFDSGYLKSGDTFSHTFTTADVGTINYFCEIHPWMTGQVIVSAAGTTSGGTNESETGNNNTTTPEFGPVASLVLVIAIVSVVAVTAKTRGFLKL